MYGWTNFGYHKIGHSQSPSTISVTDWRRDHSATQRTPLLIKIIHRLSRDWIFEFDNRLVALTLPVYSGTELLRFIKYMLLCELPKIQAKYHQDKLA